MLPTAEEYGIRIAPEIHAPTPLRSKIVDDYLDLVRETGTEHFGLLIDTGIFQTGERPAAATATRVYVFGDPDPELAAQVAREMSKPLAVDPADLVELMPYVVHVHAKFWDMTDELDRPARPVRRGRRRARRRRLPRLALERVRGAARPLPRLRHGPPPAGDAAPARPLRVADT